MQFTRLLWTAVASPRLADADLRRALDGYRHANNRDEVTGIVLYDSLYLLGCAEGSRLTVSRLLKRLATDPTFGGFELVACSTDATREYDRWYTVALGWGGLSSGDLRSVYRRCGVEAPLRPARLTVTELVALLRDAHRAFDDPARIRSAGGSQAGVETVTDGNGKLPLAAPAAVESVP